MKKRIIFPIIYTLVLVALVLVPTGFERDIYYNAEGAKAKILSVDNSTLLQIGLFRDGEQRCEVELRSGSHKGEVHEAVNLFSGSLENDKVFAVGDIAWVLVERDSDDAVIFVNMIDHYRMTKELLLALVFAAALVSFAGWKGARTILSFMFSFLVVWKILIPCALKGIAPIPVAFLAGILMSAVTLLMVGGIRKASGAAFIGTLVSSSCVLFLSWIVTRIFQLDGTQLAWSESLLYSGFQNLDLRALFQAAVYLGCLGAMMDLSIDVSITMQEVESASPGINSRLLFRSGLAIGRAGVGTQTTTLLFAYLSSYLAVLMVYMAQGTPVFNILTSKAISSEIVQTLIGCIGLVAVSPLTAVSYLFFGRNKKAPLEELEYE